VVVVHVAPLLHVQVALSASWKSIWLTQHKILAIFVSQSRLMAA
jgi:hypothetical protein